MSYTLFKLYMSLLFLKCSSENIKWLNSNSCDIHKFVPKAFGNEFNVRLPVHWIVLKVRAIQPNYRLWHYSVLGKSILQL